jgi:hypothetical protein
MALAMLRSWKPSEDRSLLASQTRPRCSAAVCWQARGEAKPEDSRSARGLPAASNCGSEERSSNKQPNKVSEEDLVSPSA